MNEKNREAKQNKPFKIECKFHIRQNLRNCHHATFYDVLPYLLSSVHHIALSSAQLSNQHLQQERKQTMK
jgi:hypothetical protein